MEGEGRVQFENGGKLDMVNKALSMSDEKFRNDKGRHCALRDRKASFFR